MLMPKRVVKHEHTHVWLTNQQLALLAMRIGPIDGDNQSNQYDEDQRVDARIKITITLSW
jgi:hypothetical protein